MIIAVASGKGGTGKTTVAINMALCLPPPVRLLDCDVEEPNCHIFLKPEIRETRSCCLPVPIIDQAACNDCGECSRICQYNAIVTLKGHPLVFPDLCHGCGGCSKNCPAGAIMEGEREIGVIEIGTSGSLEFVQGRLKVGQAMSPPLIRAVKRHAAAEGTTIIDCPPGTSCPVIAAVKGSDYAVLVTEPTPFGLHDLGLAVDTMRRLALDFGVVINRADAGDSRVAEYCRSEHIPVLLEIPDDRRVAEAYSRGQLVVEALPEMRPAFERLCRATQAIPRRRESKSVAAGKGAAECRRTQIA
jgi:MinD superfamily P-loop ATPase